MSASALSAARTGAASAAFDYALDYAKSRKQFGRPIGKFQAISHKLADMKVMLDVSRTLVYRFAWLHVAEGRRRAATPRCSSSTPARPTKQSPISVCRSSAAMDTAWNIRCSVSSATRASPSLAQAHRKSSATLSRAGSDFRIAIRLCGRWI